MAKFKCTLTKKSSSKMKAAAPGVKVNGTDFSLVDNENGSFTIYGQDAAGHQVDISAVATLAVTSSDQSYITVENPSGMTCKTSAVKPTIPGTPVTLDVVATWGDGSIGPFSLTLGCTITAGAVTGLGVVFGPATPR